MVTCPLQDFPDDYKKWHSCDPFILFEAPIRTYVDKVGSFGPISASRHSGAASNPWHIRWLTRYHFCSASPCPHIYLLRRLPLNSQPLLPCQNNLLREAATADLLIIWTDCDREGEHIGSEVAAVCRRAKPGIRVKRARFSAIIGE